MQGAFFLWRQHQICAVALLALGLGLIIGCASGVTVVSSLLGLCCLCGGCFLLKKK